MAGGLCFCWSRGVESCSTCDRHRPRVAQFGELRYVLDTAAFAVVARLGRAEALVDVAHNPLPTTSTPSHNRWKRRPPPPVVPSRAYQACSLILVLGEGPSPTCSAIRRLPARRRLGRTSGVLDDDHLAREVTGRGSGVHTEGAASSPSGTRSVTTTRNSPRSTGRQKAPPVRRPAIRTGRGRQYGSSRWGGEFATVDAGDQFGQLSGDAADEQGEGIPSIEVYVVHV